MLNLRNTGGKRSRGKGEEKGGEKGRMGRARSRHTPGSDLGGASNA